MFEHPAVVEKLMWIRQAEMLEWAKRVRPRVPSGPGPGRTFLFRLGGALIGVGLRLQSGTEKYRPIFRSD
jgi:hypothetical protein